MTRTQNVKRNLIFNIVRFATQLVLQFVLRTILIYYMGNEYIGLNGLFTNIFNFLSLAELGIGNAIVFSMYKPIAQNDIEKVKALQNLYKKFYLIIAIIIIAVGGVITPFVNVFINGEVTVDINIYILFVMYLVNSIVGYFSAHKRSLLFAYQRNDVENKIKTLLFTLMTVTQIIVILLTKNYYLFFAVNIVFTILESVFVHIMANKLIPEINGKGSEIDASTKKQITKNITALSLHRIGSAIVNSTDTILVSSFFGVVVLGAYSNYALIISSLTTLFSLVTTAFSGSVGNLIASTNIDYAYGKFKQINFLFSYLSSFCTICLICLFQPFIKVWTGGGEYLLNFSTVVIISLSFYFSKMRLGVNMFKDCAGLYWQDRWKPLVEALVNLGVSILLAFFMGIDGIFIGTIISTFAAPLWVEPLVLYKHYFKKKVSTYFTRYLLDFLIMAVSCVICYIVCYFIPDGSIWWLILKFAVCIMLSNVLLILAYLPTKEFKEWLGLIKDALKGLKTRIKTKKQQEINVDEDKQDKIKEEGQLEEPLNNLTSNDSNEMRDAENDLVESQEEIKNEVSQLNENQGEIKEEKATSNINLDTNE